MIKPKLGDVIRISRFKDPRSLYRLKSPIFDFHKTGLCIVTNIDVNQYIGEFSYGINIAMEKELERTITIFDIMWEDGSTDCIWWEVHTLDGLHIEILSSNVQT